MGAITTAALRVTLRFSGEVVFAQVVARDLTAYRASFFPPTVNMRLDMVTNCLVLDAREISSSNNLFLFDIEISFALQTHSHGVSI